MAKTGLYANIHAKQERIERQKAAGKTPERMRTPGSKGAPTAAALSNQPRPPKNEEARQAHSTHHNG